MSIAHVELLFDQHFRARAGGRLARSELTARAETEDDRAFLLDLHAACSPLRGLLPSALLDHQARAQADSFERAHPDAMRRIGLLDGRPIGRFVIDWTKDCAHGVDIAVLPTAPSSRLAMSWLRSWVAVADQTSRSCSLSVRHDNPAMLIYRRLGFAATSAGHGGQPFLTMLRPLPNADDRRDTLASRDP